MQFNFPKKKNFYEHFRNEVVLKNYTMLNKKIIAYKPTLGKKKFWKKKMFHKRLVSKTTQIFRRVESIKCSIYANEEV